MTTYVLRRSSSTSDGTGSGRALETNASTETDANIVKDISSLPIVCFSGVDSLQSVTQINWGLGHEDCMRSCGCGRDDDEFTTCRLAHPSHALWPIACSFSLLDHIRTPCRGKTNVCLIVVKSGKRQVDKTYFFRIFLLVVGS